MRFNEIAMLVPDMRAWHATNGDWSFVISYEPRSGQGYEGYTGYTASWKNMNADMAAFGSQPANRIDGGPWETYGEAATACEAMLKKLKQQN